VFQAAVTASVSCHEYIETMNTHYCWYTDCQNRTSYRQLLRTVHN